MPLKIRKCVEITNAKTFEVFTDRTYTFAKKKMKTQDFFWFHKNALGRKCPFSDIVYNLLELR
jgi:hypothetical protein